MRGNGITVVIESDRQWFGQPWQRVSRICEPIRRFNPQAAAAIRGPGENHQYSHRPDYPPLRIVRLPHARMVAENTKLRDIAESVPHCLSYVRLCSSREASSDHLKSSRYWELEAWAKCGERVTPSCIARSRSRSCPMHWHPIQSALSVLSAKRKRSLR